MRKDVAFYHIVGVVIFLSIRFWTYLEDRADGLSFYRLNELYKTKLGVKNDFKVFGLSIWKN